MSARVLVVDDIAANAKLLEAKLTSEYFDVVTATNGQEALEKTAACTPDIVLLDVMMPGMDGFEVCRRIKANPESTYVPVVMVTALDQPSDRVAGLEAGADDFLTKPVNDIALMARVKSLVRLKLTTDELRMRERTGRDMGLLSDGQDTVLEVSVENGRVLVFEERRATAMRIRETLEAHHTVHVEPDAKEAILLAKSGDFDLFIVSLSAMGTDGLRFCSTLRTEEETRRTPILALVEEGDNTRLIRGLEMGVNDYLMRPLDRNELLARARTQIRMKRYQDSLRHNVQLSLEMAITDQLTGLHNRRYMENHLGTLVSQSVARGKPVSFLIMDIDHFKGVNDTHGHDVGDEVLREFARRISANVRGLDLACRYGGEEFVVVMPETDANFAFAIAERLREQVADKPFAVSTEAGTLDLTISIGVAVTEGAADSPEQLLKRADMALYEAKNAGRNRVVRAAA